MKTNTGLWPALERLATGKALLIDWQRQLGKEFDASKTLLLPTTEKATRYPCMDPFPCSCHHRIYETTIKQNPPWPNAACECEGDEHCEPFFVPEKDLVIWRFNAGTLALAIRSQLAAANLVSGVDADSILEMNGGPHRPSHWLVAGRRTFESSVIVASPFNADELLRTAETLASPYGDRFLLLTPTRRHYSEAFEVALKRRGCLALPLNELFRLGPAGSLETIGANYLSAAFEHLKGTQAAGNAIVNPNGTQYFNEAKAASSAPVKAAKPDPDSLPASGQRGRLRWENNFEDLWLGADRYDLRNRNPARYCIKFLVGREAFDKASARHLVNEIDPYVRKHAKMYELRDPDGLRIHRYFKDDTGKLQALRDELVKSAGRNGCFFLQVK